MVLSNHQKLRVLELHGRLSNTQKQIFKNNLNGAASFDGIVDGVQQEFEPQRTIHTSLWNALQLKEVNNKFYRIVADHFQELVDSIRNQGKTAEDAQQFSSRLLGRLLFIWFLRKMDIIDETQQYFETASLSADDYYDSKVKTLFFRTLNTEIEDRQHSDSVTPYLNGRIISADFGSSEISLFLTSEEMMNASFNPVNIPRLICTSQSLKGVPAASILFFMPCSICERIVHESPALYVIGTAFCRI